MENHMTVTFDAISENEAFARMVVSAFLSGSNPTMEELADVKTAVSEAVTNAIIHGYQEKRGRVELQCDLWERQLRIEIRDRGEGIFDIEKAKEPFFTTKPELERSGLGFAFMETFMDQMEVHSTLGQGTQVILHKKLKEIS